MFGAWFGGLKTSLPSLLVAAAAIGLTITWLKVDHIATLLVVIGLAACGILAYFLGTRALAGDRPRPTAALVWFECAAIAPVAIGAAAAAALILVGIEYAPARSWSVQTTKLVAAGTAALTTYLTVGLIRGAEQADKNFIGTVVKQRFQAAFANRFADTDENRDARDAVFSEVNYVGWSRPVRRRRARAIEAALRR
jgi:hypothetical protein